jgi:hypothetical protein
VKFVSQDLVYINRTAHIRHQCRKTTALNCHRCRVYTGVEKMKQHLNIDLNFDHQMSLSKSKCWCSNNCLHFLKRAVPLNILLGQIFQGSTKLKHFVRSGPALRYNLKYLKNVKDLMIYS